MGKNKNKRTRKFVGTAFQKKLLFVIFASAVVPAGLVTVSLYYLIFNLLVWQIGMPEGVGVYLVPALNKINLVILVSLPIVLLLIWIIALEVSHRIAGPIFRIEKELDTRISGDKIGPIKLRRRDEFKILTDKINQLLAR